MIIILDIDETLVHSRKGISVASMLIDKAVKPSDTFTVFDYLVQKRPHLDMFLSRLLNDDYYEVGIWSAGSYEYVHSIVDIIIPPSYRKNLRFVMTADDCNEMRDKPLSKVRDRFHGTSVHDYLIVDDRDGVTGHDELNHLQIAEFEGDIYDDELLRLWEYLDIYRYHSSEYLVVHWK